MRRMGTWISILLLAGVWSLPAWAGNQTANDFFYKPKLGARGVTEKSTYDAGLDRVDARLGKETWVGDPKFGSTLQDAIATIGSSNVILRVPAGTHVIAGDFSIPSNVALRVERGAIFSIAPGQTLTINGPFEAGLHQVFSCAGTGKVAFGQGSLKEIYPQWWGAVGDGVTDCRPAIQAALVAGRSSARGMTIVFPNGTYFLNSFDTWDTTFLTVAGLTSTGGSYKLTLRGEGNPIITCSATFKNATAAMGFTFFQFRGSADVKVEGITFERPDAAVDKLSAAFVFYDDGATDTTFSFINCTFRNFYIGIYGGGAVAPSVRNCKFYATNGRGSFYTGASTWPAVGILGGDTVMNRDWLVDGNIFDGCVSGTVAGSYAWDGLVLSYGPGQVITNNRLRNIGVEGIYVYRLTTPPDNNKKYVVSNNLIDCTPPTGGALINWGIRCDENNAVITGNSICGATCGIMTGPYDHAPQDLVISDNIIQMKFFNGGGSYAIYGIQASAKNAKIHHNLIVWNDSLTGYSALFVCGIYAAANLDRSSITHNKVLVRHPDATIPMEGFRINGDGSTNIFFKDNETDGVSWTFSFDTIYPTAGPWTIETHASKNDNLMFYQPPSPSSYGGKLLVKNQIFAWTPAQTGWYRVLAKPWNISSRFIFGSLNSLSNDAAVEVAYYSDNSSLFNGSINQLRYTKHSSSVITKVRTGTVPAPLGYMCALDIYVAVANKPITLALQGNEQYDLYLLSEMVAGPVWQTRSAPESSPATPEHLKSLTLTDGIATSGGITVGDETVNYAPGTIRFNGTNFFGWNGTAWKQLDN